MKFPEGPKEIRELMESHLSGALHDRLGGSVVTKNDSGVFVLPPQLGTFYVPVLMRPRKNGAVRINFARSESWDRAIVNAYFNGAAINNGTTVPEKKDSDAILLFVVKVRPRPGGDSYFSFEIVDEKGGGVDVHVP